MLDLGTPGMTAVADGLLGWFAETTLVAAALAALAALVARIRRLAPGPAARHALWLIVLIKLVTPPLVHWPWSVPAALAATRSGPARAEEPAPREVAPARAAPPPAAPGPGPDRAAASAAGPPAVVEVGPAPPAAPPAPPVAPGMTWPAPPPGSWVALAWLAGSIALGIGQARRVGRFRRLLRGATPAPAWLVAEAEQLGRRLDVRVPAIRVVPGLGTPVLWCLGRPVLLVPAKLLGTLEAGRWRSIVAHELAHLRRGDHWVRRLELAAGLAWWWNPVYWLARNRLDFEAELACDAWAVWAAPADRLTYAESLIRICTAFSPAPARPPSPALGVAGTGRSFERRLTMILRDRVDRRVSAPCLLAAALLAALALPSWTQAEPPLAQDVPAAADAAARPDPAPPEPPAPPSAPAAPAPPAAPSAPSTDDDDDDDDDAKPAARSKADRARRAKKQAEVDQTIAKEFGADSDFARKMDALGKEMEAKFGPGSEFVKKMEAMGAEMEAKFGPGSEFAKEMERIGSESAATIAKRGDAAKDGDRDDAKAKADGKKARDAAAKGRADAARARSDAAKARDAATKARIKAAAEARTKPTPDARARRIEALESRLDELMKELKALKAAPQSDDEADGQG